MYILTDLFLNKIFIAPAAAWLIAQALKIIIDCYICGFNRERLVESGGMPSSHAATVVALVGITGACIGTGSFEFALAFFFGFITLYDARGVRFETQRQGKALNNLNDEREEEGKQPLDIKRFKEKMGHTMPELLAGGVIGIICAVIVYYLPF
ncbi:hypothetical protein SAMN05421493_10369 [Pseudobutyrivibrio sp. 49]|uniref:divergent PAP2 family protein n=1 Tax=unclassified Pseudobutyrivibrio TaxID=2638619 RepID=UPI00087F6840|nr:MULTISPECIES: divergent PAP2 family protein [unclassified Pseudobutyrivibrio]SDH69486.1 hypothetical protein SAMN05421493_10369 [Pseudobutyrivibrio sp. 49]SFN72829.1 hypothetical protein SAMN04487831_10370 [Pseudobutyrivibrio sp. UC1225]